MTEIERKFSVIPEIWETLEKPEPVFIAQGYLQHDAEKTIRVRIKGSQGYLTLKSAGNGISREEWEYPIPTSDARELLERFAPQRIEKFRYRIAASRGLTWEVDVFVGANEGLLLAEIELPAEDYPFEKPDWLGEERTGQRQAITRDDLLTVAQSIGFRKAKEALDRIREIILKWPDYAQSFQVNSELIQAIQQTLLPL